MDIITKYYGGKAKAACDKSVSTAWNTSIWDVLTASTPDCLLIKIIISFYAWEGNYKVWHLFMPRLDCDIRQ